MSVATVLTQVAMTFNLVCTGTSDATAGGSTATTVYRVDLASMRYCMDDCVNVLPIKSVTAKAITFEDGAKGADGIRVARAVNRKTLAFMEFVDADLFRSVTKGVCKVADFTGLP